MIYLALPTKENWPESVLDFGIENLPLKIYAIPNVEDVRGVAEGIPPYFKVTGVTEDDEPILEELAEGSREFNSVRKWVGTIPVQRTESAYRRQPNRGRKAIHAGAPCVCEEKFILYALTGKEKYLPQCLAEMD